MPPYRFSKTIFSDYSATLIALLRQARLDAGMTQVQAAERLGCRQTFLSKIECGERRIDVVEFSMLCLAYGASPSALLHDFVKKAGLPRFPTDKHRSGRGKGS